MRAVVVGFGRNHLQQRHDPAFNSQASAQDKMKEHGGVAQQPVCALNAVLILCQTFNAVANCGDRAPP